MLDDIQNKRRLTHRRTRRNQNKIGRLESRRPVIQIDKSGRNTRDGAVALRRRLNLFQNIQHHLADRHKLSASAALEQVKHRFLRVRQNILQLVPSAVTEVFNLLIHFYQTAQDCLFPHDIGIRFDIDRGRHRCHDIPDKVKAADLRRNIFFAQPILKRHQIDRLSFIEKLDHRLKHDAVLVLVKIGACDNLRRRDNCFPIHKHGSDD